MKFARLNLKMHWFFKLATVLISNKEHGGIIIISIIQLTRIEEP